MSRRSKPSSTKRLRAIIWCAVSSEPQAAPDKISLDEQERAGREFAEKEGYDIVRIFRWDGYSRWESDPIAALEDFASKGRYDYHQLREMWRAQEYDVFICYTHSRPGRSFTMQSWVIENSIRAGARVYRIQGGWIDDVNYTWQIGIGGVLTTNEVHRLVVARDAAMPGLIERGIFPSSRPPISHKKTRNDKGEQTGLELDETKRPLWNALAELLLSGVGYVDLGTRLAEIGFTDNSGRSYSDTYFYKLLHTAPFWGHLAIDITERIGKRKKRHLGPWAYREDAELPDGATIVRNVVPAVYTGDQADKVMAELDRRHGIRGKTRPYNTHRYAGLFLCGSCFRPLGHTYSHDPSRPLLRCYSNGNRTRYRVECEQPQSIKLGDVDDFVKRFLTAIVAGNKPDMLLDLDLERSRQQMEVIEKDIERQQSALETLIEQQSYQAEHVQPYYNKRIGELATTIDHLKAQRQAINEQLASSERAVHSEHMAVEQLRELGIDKFLAQPDEQIHSWLSFYLDRRRFLVMDKQVVRLVKKPERAKERNDSRKRSIPSIVLDNI